MPTPFFWRPRFLAAFGAMVIFAGCQIATPPPEQTTSVTPSTINYQQAIAARTDVWGNAALNQPAGPTYDYFAKLLPPLRYVGANFHFYPIPLSAPGARLKGRLLSDGSQINALAHQPNWHNEFGIPVHILVGDARQPFGTDFQHLDGPRYLDGYLPIIQLSYQQKADRYQQEVFASTDPHLAPYGTVLVRFTFPAANKGRIELQFEDGYIPLDAKDGNIKDAKGRILASYDGHWEWNKAHSSLISEVKHPRTAAVAIYTVPISSERALTVNGAVYDQQRQQCEQFYNDLVDRGMTVDVPEQYVNNAWRSLLIGTYAMTVNNDLYYSASNQYARMYPAETGDAIQSLILWGHAAQAATNLPSLLRYGRPNLEYHDAAFNLETVAFFYRQTHDQEFIRSIRPLWQRQINRLTGAVSNSKSESRNSKQIQSSKSKIQNVPGLLPREQYCSDISTLVHNLASNAVAWRAIHDIIPVLSDLGDTVQAGKLTTFDVTYQKAILAAINKYINRSVNPPFVPIALGEESPHNPITSTRLGSYWNLVIGYVLNSGVFPYNSPLATDILHYQQQNGGLCMGMIRCHSARSFWVNQNQQNIDDLYGLRYALTLLKRDEPDRALVSFYGKLAQGLTRNTFIGAEATSIQPLDQFGRQMYLPPNSTSNASFLQQLRYLLIQDWDLRNSGRPDTLRLLFATPRAWLADGKTISIQDAPTAFGTMSMTISSHINRGNVEADLDLPDQSPKTTLLRLRLPAGHRLLAASAEGKDLKITGETIDLTGLTGQVTVEARVR